MKFSPDTTFASVTEKFLQRANLKMSKHFFGIFLNVGGEFVQMQPQWNMTSFPLPSPVLFFSLFFFYKIEIYRSTSRYLPVD